MNRKNISLVIGILFIVFIILFSFHNDFLYSTPILKITEINLEEIEESSNPLGFTEKYYMQTITGILTNTKEKGKSVTIENECTSSDVVTETYQIGDKLLISNGEIKSLKRDAYLITITGVFIIGLLLIGHSQGFLTIVSVVMNTIIFCVGIKIYLNGMSLLFLCVLESFLFASISLLLTNGFHKKTYISIFSVFLSFTILILLTLLITQITDYQGISFNEIGFLTVPVTDVLICELLIGGLGAIMDIAITITSATNELIEKNPNISKKDLRVSLSNIGSDVMGTMVNVLFFTYFCGGLPIFVLAIRNGYTIFNFFRANFSIELSRFLIGSIGILLTIPTTILLSTNFYKRGERHE